MIEISDAALAAMDAAADEEAGTKSEQPVVMLNLLRFRPDGGRESYARYATHLRERGVSARYRTEVLYAGTGGPALVAEDGQAWDMVLLVRYPDRRTFVDMIRDPDYRAGAHHRSAALLESVLQPTVPQ